jgi:influenza virus NS1A-binding protein
VEADLPQWQPREGLSVPRDDFATAVVGEEIWVLGGLTGDRGNRLDSIEIYNTRTGDWRVFDETMPEGLASFEGAAVGEEVFVFGGLDRSSRPSDSSAVLDTSTGKWQQLPALPVPRYAHTVTLHEGLIHVIGGEGPRGPVARVDVFDPATRSWSTGAPMPQARGSHKAVSTGDVIYVLGGFLDSGPTNLVQTYEPGSGQWASAQPLPEPVSRAGAAVVDGRLWVSRHEFSAVLGVDEGTWSPANPLTVSRHGLGYVAVGTSIYGIGGCTETPLRDVRTVDVLELDSA